MKLNSAIEFLDGKVRYFSVQSVFAAKSYANKSIVKVSLEGVDVDGPPDAPFDPDDHEVVVDPSVRTVKYLYLGSGFGSEYPHGSRLVIGARFVALEVVPDLAVFSQRLGAPSQHTNDILRDFVALVENHHAISLKINQ